MNDKNKYEPVHLKNENWKWMSIFIMILGAIPLSFNLVWFPFSISFLLLLVGHSTMTILMYSQKETSLVAVNGFWCILDVIGIIRWI
jgi:hypothetical protein